MKGIKLSHLSIVASLVFSVSSFAGIYIQPYLQNPKTDGMTVMWWTDNSQSSSEVEYGSSYGNTVAASNDYVPSMGKYKHEATLSGLNVESAYNYRVKSGGMLSSNYTFHTVKKRSSNFRVAVLGDGRSDNTTVQGRHRTVLNQAADRGSDLIFEAGDEVYSGSATQWGNLYRKILTSSDSTSTVASRIPYHTVVGNHEIYDESTVYAGGNLNTSMARYKAMASNPDNGSSNPNWKERYYTIKYGVATFIVLDANNTSDDSLDNHDYLNDGDTPDWQPGSEQYNWMINELQKAKNNGAFTFVLFHPSPYSRGTHGTDDPNINKQRGYELRTLDPVFRQYGVDAVIASHDHTVEHCLTGPSGYESQMDETDPNNLNYITMGNSGEASRSAENGWQNWMQIPGAAPGTYYTKYFYGWAGDDTKASSVDINFTNQQDGTWKAAFQIVRNDGETFDQWSIERADVPEPMTIMLLILPVIAWLKSRR